MLSEIHRLNITIILIIHRLAFPADIGRKPALPACESR